MSIKTISSREVYRNPWTSVREDVIERANGQRGIYGVIDKDPASIIIPLEVTAEGEFVYLIEQFRYTLTAERMTLLSTLQIAYGVMNQKHYIFLAEGLTHGAPQPDDEEHDLVLRRVSVAEFERMVLSGEIVDNSSIAAWGLYKVWLEHGRPVR